MPYPLESYKGWTEPEASRKPYDPERCAAEINTYPFGMGLQCKRKRGHGRDDLYCKQHSKKHQ